MMDQVKFNFFVEYIDDRVFLKTNSKAITNDYFEFDFSEENLNLILSKMIEIDGTISKKIKRKSEFNWRFIVEKENVQVNRFKNLIPFIIKSKKLDQILFNFQKEGANWLLKNKFCILADDMGLGKTIQSIAAIEKVIFQNKKSNVFIFCPNSLMANWSFELKKWSPNLIVSKFDSSQDYNAIKIASIINQSNISIVPYSHITKTLMKISERDLNIDLIICDEAHKLRNTSSKINNSILKIKKDSMWFLTGTPLERDDKDIRNLLTLLQPKKSQSYSLASDIILHHNLNKISLRRLKKDVLTELPEVEKKIEYLEMTDEQKSSYRKITSTISKIPQGDRIGLITNLLVAAAGGDVLNSCKYIRSHEIIEDCISLNQKVIVFSNFNSLLFNLKKFLLSKNINSLIYNGEIDTETRNSRLDQFKRDVSYNVLLMNSRVGSEGLTITEASNIIFINEWWNPSSNRQAEDRINRIGQKHTPNIYILRAINTIDEILGDILSQKNTLEKHFEEALLAKFENENSSYLN